MVKCKTEDCPGSPSLPPELSPPQSPPAATHLPVSLQSAHPSPPTSTHSTTHLLTLLLGNPSVPVHGADELISQFVEQGTLGVALPIEETKDFLFRSLVVLLHVIGQVAGERNQVAL